ncbi:MAG TPA: hypothetical protein VKB46_00665, partial [Pyrinomonadaceae bacterium]|nr:hypothetical protein [Pyrinomonadaceae bacterium]
MSANSSASSVACGRKDTTGFSRVEFQFRPSLSDKPAGRYHRLQPGGVSISTYKGSFTDTGDTTGFSRVEFQFQPTKRREELRLKLKLHRLKPVVSRV